MNEPPTASNTMAALEAERNLLSAIIQNPAAAADLPELSPLDFFSTNHKLILSAVLALINDEQPIDRAFINERVDVVCRGLETARPDSLDQALINDIVGDQVPAGLHRDYYRLIREKCVLRKVHAFTAKWARRACEFGHGEDVDSFLDQLEEEALRFRKVRSVDVPVKDAHDVLKESIDAHMESLKSPQPIKKGIMTGITQIDNHTVGMQAGEMVVVAARPSAGKTALLMQIAMHNALRDVPVAAFSLEMDADSLMGRGASMLSGVSTLAVKQCQVTAMERDTWSKSYLKLKQGAMKIDDDPSVMIEDIRARARRLVREFGVKVILIDYLQLITPSKKDRNAMRDEKVGNISQGCKAMARELNLPVVVLAQLNRDLEKRDDKVPRLSDLRDSGRIEQDGDHIWAIHRPHGNDSDAFNIHCLKARNTGIFPKVELIFDGETQRITQMNDSQPDLL